MQIAQNNESGSIIKSEWMFHFMIDVFLLARPRGGTDLQEWDKWTNNQKYKHFHLELVQMCKNNHKTGNHFLINK